jgi:hypothetical protein
MRIVAAIVVLLCVAGSLCVHAQPANFSAFSLVGKWSVSGPTPNGGTMTTELTLMPNMKFSGSSSAEGRAFWTLSGTWEVKGDEVIWHYETSSRPLPDSAKIDSDRIVSVDRATLVLISNLSGREHVYSRVK